MTCNDIRKLLDDFVDSNLPAEEAARVRAHVDGCAECARELAALESLRAATNALPNEIEPDSDLWQQIESSLNVVVQEAESGRARVIGLSLRGRKAVWVVRAGLVAAAVALVVVGAREWRSRSHDSGWEVTRIAGAPVIESRGVHENATLRQGEWLRTDENSSARVDVANIGRVTVGPESAVRLKGSSDKEHRIELARGEMEAFIWAPPRLFFVDTPSGVAEDLGCRYNLAVDEDGNGALDVTLGFVSFERDGREVIVPAGARCELRAGTGPGTPHESGASRELQEALGRVDVEGATPENVTAVLHASSNTDGVTLWHLIPRVDQNLRGEVVDALAARVPLPKETSREGVIALDARMLERWWDAMYPSWSHWN
jgi:hypothetical protein